PMSICRQAMVGRRPSREMLLVRPVMACFVAVYGAEWGRGACAEMEPLLMIRPPRGRCAFMSLMASWAQRNAPVRLTATTRIHCSERRSSSGMAGGPGAAVLWGGEGGAEAS